MKNKLQRLLIMSSKFTLYGMILQLFFIASLWATELAAQETKSVKEVNLSIKVESQSILDVFRIIEQKTAFKFFYENKYIDRSLRYDFKSRNISVNDILLQISRNSNLKFKQINNTINVTTKDPGQRGRESAIEIIIQTRSVSGRVTTMEDEDEGLPGVNVIEMGTTNGTVTNINGEYSLDVSEGATLVFSSVGYTSEEIEVGNRSVIDLVMTADIQQLQELVVIGFGERRKKDLTGSIATVDAKAIEKSTAVSPQFALQGNAPGVRVVNASGDPNDAPQIFVRGVGTWNGDAQPLYVIDGQIIEPPRAGNEDVIAGNGLSTPPNLFNLINPNDIESITVLKDASSAAIYGSRGANGVVLITTKKGKMGKPVVEVNTRTGVQNIPTYDLLNTTQFVDLAREMYDNNTNPDILIEEDLYGRNIVDDASRLIGFNPQFDPQSPFYISDRTTYNWQDELVRDNALNQSYNVKVSGATEMVDYYISAGYTNQESNLVGNELDRYTGAVNINVKVTDWLKTGINYKYTHQLSVLNDRGELADIADVSPWQPLRDPTNEYGYAPVIDPYGYSTDWQPAKIYGQGSNTNFLALSQLDYRDFTINRNLGQFYLEVNPFKGFRLRGSLNLDFTKQDRFGLDTWSRTNIFKPTGVDPTTEAPNAPNSLGGMGHRINNIHNFQSDLTATYDFSLLDKHNFTLTAAVQDQRHRRELVNLGGDNLLNLNDRDPKLNGYSNDLANNSSIYGWDQRFWFGYVGRLNYSFEEKYYLDASIRRDASNGFDDDFRWGTFYSLSGAWRISSEPFFAAVNFVDDLKIRAGWGEAGNDQAAVGRYAFLSGVTGASSVRWGSGGGNPLGNFQPGSLVNDFPNQSLTWEVVTTSYVGFDALLFNNKMNITVEWFNRSTDGILQRVNLPYSVGTGNPLFNIGSVANKGVDLMIGWNEQINDFSYGISANAGFLHNEVTNLYQGQPLFTDEFGRVEEGRSVGHIWEYKMGGIFQTQAEIDAYFEGVEDQTIDNSDYVEPGDVYFVDLGGAPTDEERFYSTSPDSLINAFDRTEVGKTIPSYTYGLNLNFGWKGFDLSFNFYGEGDVQKINNVRRGFEGMSGPGNNYWATTLNRWTPSNPSTTMPRAVVGDPAENNRTSTRWVEDASFFRLNNWQLGYSLPNNLLEGMNNVISSARIFVGGQNNLYLFSWQGIDPVNDTFPLAEAWFVGLNARF